MRVNKRSTQDDMYALRYEIFGHDMHKSNTPVIDAILHVKANLQPCVHIITN